MRHVLPFFPPVVVLISGYERVDMTSLVTPRFREMLPSSVMVPHTTAEREKRSEPVQWERAVPFLASTVDAFSCPIPNAAPHEKEDALSLHASLGTRREALDPKERANGEFPSAVASSTQIAAMERKRRSSSASEGMWFPTVWSCRRAPKYARQQKALQELHTYPQRRREEEDGGLPMAVSTHTTTVQTVMGGIATVPCAPSRDEAPLIPTPLKTSQASSPTHTTLHDVCDKDGEEETGRHTSGIPVGNGAVHRRPTVSGVEAVRRTHGDTKKEKRNEKEKNGASVVPFGQGRLEEASLLSSMNALWSWWQWVTAVPFGGEKSAPPSGDQRARPLPCASASSSCMDAKDRPLDASPPIPPMRSSPFIPSVATAASLRSSASWAGAPTTSAVLHFGGDLLGVLVPFSFFGVSTFKTGKNASSRFSSSSADVRLCTSGLSTTGKVPNAPPHPLRKEKKKVVERRIAAFQSLTQKQFTPSGALFSSSSAAPSPPPALSPSPPLPLTDLSFPEDGYYPLFLSFGDVNTTLSQLLGTFSSTRREELRGAFGISLPLLLAALPSILVDAVRRIQHWEATASTSSPPPPPGQRRRETGTSSATFLVSCVCHYCALVESTTPLRSSLDHDVSPTFSLSDLLTDVWDRVLHLGREEKGEEGGTYAKAPLHGKAHDGGMAFPLLHHAASLGRDGGPTHRLGHAIRTAGQWLSTRVAQGVVAAPPPQEKEKKEDPSSLRHGLVKDSPRPPPEMPSLYASVSTLLALGTVRMVLHTSAAYTAWVEAGMYSGSENGATHPSSGEWHAGKGGVDAASSPSSVTPPPLSFPPWRYNFFLPEEHFDTAEERILWARRGSGRRAEDKKKREYFLQQRSTSPVPKKGEEDWSMEWVSCVECLLELLL